MQLAELGERICILGPSNSGKSTLANAISRTCNLPCVHLDQLFHKPETNWVPRPPDEFRALHDGAIATDRWVMDGNYSSLFPQRFRRATGLVLLDVSTVTSLLRYIRRSLLKRERCGALEGGQDSIKMSMLHHIAVVTPRNRRRYARMYEELALPRMRLASVSAIRRQYRVWSLL